jgi:hypothetical protein
MQKSFLLIGKDYMFIYSLTSDNRIYYSLCLKKIVVVDFDQLYLTVRLIQNFYINSKINKLLLKYL